MPNLSKSISLDNAPVATTWLARRAWDALRPIALDIHQTVNGVHQAAMKVEITIDIEKDIEILGRSNSALMRQLEITIAAMNSADLDESRMGHLRHDLRTPLNALKGYCQLLQEDSSNFPELNSALGNVKQLVDGFGRAIDKFMPILSDAQDDSVNFSYGGNVTVENDFVGAKILLVEDHDESRAVAARFLRKAGYEIYEVADGASALDQLKLNSFDIVLLDHHLPDFEGNEILISMKSDVRLSSMPVVMMSAGDEARQIGVSLKLGADDYVAKPIDPVLLRARISACLDRKRLRERNNAFWLDSLKKVMDLAVDGIVILTATGEIVTANPIACSIFGISSNNFAGRPFGPSLGKGRNWVPEGRPKSSLDDAGGAPVLREIEGYREGGEAFPLEIAIREVEGIDQSRFVAICRDATARKAEERRMAFLARHDPITELPNRVAFIDWINEALQTSGANGALLLIQVSWLRDQAEMISLAKGTNVLRMIGKTIVPTIPHDARLASLGNDQFGIVFAGNPGIAFIEKLADRIFAAIPRVAAIDDAEIDLEACIAITEFPNDGSSSDQLVRNLDLAIARARRERDRSTCIFHRDMWHLYRANRNLERNLAEALEGGKLEMHFQAKVGIKDFKVMGGEALIRWPHPVRGYIPPSEFIPVAESSGLIVPLGQFVIEETVRQIAEWTALGHKVPPIALNVSPIQFRRTDLVNLVRQATSGKGIPGSALEIEITENLFLHDQFQVSRILMHLRSLGASIAIDDFGTGHSSLSYLADLPVDTLKIDQSFVRRLEHSDQNREIVRTIAQLAQNLNLQTVAEGVEQIGQAKFLETVGCTVAQGYYFARPVPAKQFSTLFDQILPAVE